VRAKNNEKNNEKNTFVVQTKNEFIVPSTVPPEGGGGGIFRACICFQYTSAINCQGKGCCFDNICYQSLLQLSSCSFEEKRPFL
jgi:hypothetical protein